MSRQLPQISLFRRFRDPVRQFQVSLLLLLGLILAGTLGYLHLEGMSLADSLYMTVITLTTVGFQEVQPLSVTGRLFTVALIFTGVGAAAWVARSAVEIALGEHLWKTMSRRRLERMIDRLTQHYIICGYGRMGRAIKTEFQRRGAPFVIVEMAEEMVSMLLEKDLPFVQGDATLDEVLLEAGIERARGIVAAVDRDADNVMITITAKGLNPGAVVVARADSEEAARKLYRAGADEVLSPHSIGGQRMALSVLRPTVAELLSRLVYDEQEATELEEIRVAAGCPWVGQTLAQTNMRRRWSAIVIGAHSSEGEIAFVPPADQQINEGDTLVILVPQQRLNAIRAVAAGQI